MKRSPPALVSLVILGFIAVAAAYLTGLAGGASSKAFHPQAKGGVQDGHSSWELRKGSGWSPANLTLDEAVALKLLCRLAMYTKGGAWHSERINAAISVLAFGADPPDNLQATVYKSCMSATGLGIGLP
jgi:hypothetical protein